MKRILQLTAVIALLATTGCLVVDEGGHGHWRGRGRVIVPVPPPPPVIIVPAEPVE